MEVCPVLHPRPTVTVLPESCVGPWGQDAWGEAQTEALLESLRGRGPHQAEPQREQVSSGQGHSTSSRAEPSAAGPLGATLQTLLSSQERGAVLVIWDRAVNNIEWNARPRGPHIPVGLIPYRYTSKGKGQLGGSVLSGGPRSRALGWD